MTAALGEPLAIAMMLETDGPGGAERMVLHLATTLRRQGHDAEARAFFERYVKEAPATEARDVAAARAWLKAQARASP